MWKERAFLWFFLSFMAIFYFRVFILSTLYRCWYFRSEDEVVAAYSQCWMIETFFKNYKQDLNAVSRCRARKYSAAVKSWRENWNELATFFRYPCEIRKLIYVEDHRIQPKQTTYFNQTKYHRFQPKYGRVQSKYDYFLIFGNLGVVPKSTCVTILFFPL